MQFFLTLFKRTLSNLGGPALRESDQSWIPPSRRLAHNGEKQDFSMEVVGSFQSCLERQINEAVRITSSQADFIMNSKSEFHQAPIVRVVTTNGLQTEQGEDQGWVAVGDRGGGRRIAGRGTS